MIERYAARYREFRYSPVTLGWPKGKQDIRFLALTSFCDLSGMHVLDIGCGFGDLNRVLARYEGYEYTGLDLVPELLEEGRRRYGTERIHFVEGEFLSCDLQGSFDFSLASGIFNRNMPSVDQYGYVDSVLKKALSVSREGVAFDFLSDKVDFRNEINWHHSPERILELAYRYSRNVVLRNDYMPFEFTLCVFKDDSFERADTVFNRFKRQHPGLSDVSKMTDGETVHGELNVAS